jgi:hypothetical protein
MPMSHPTRDSETQTAELDSQPSIGLGSNDLTDPPESQWVRSQLPLLYKILDRLDGEELTPRQHIRALRNLKRPLLEMVKALSRLDALESDPKVSPLSPSPTSAQRLLERMCRNLEHLLLTLDRHRFQSGASDDVDRRWTIRQLFAYLGHQIEYGILGARPWPPRTWQRLHDLFEYLVERRGLELGTGSSDLGQGLDPETAYKRLLLLGLCPRLKGVRRLNGDVVNQLTQWAIESRLGQPAAHLGEYGLIVVETSQDGPARYRKQPADDPWRGWVLEPPGEFLAFAGIQRPSLSLAERGDDTRALFGGRR